jgi:cobalt-zinc-cadmium efflux system outer membrane protein
VGVVNWTRWLGELDIGFELEREKEGGRLTGPTLAWEVPIFNQHQDALLRTNTELQIAINDVRRITVDVDNSVRLAYANVNNARERVVEYQDVLIPQRVATVASAQQEFSYMLIGAFELIALKQDEYDTYQGYLEAIGDYWVARAELGLATGTVLPSSGQIGEQRVDVDQFTRPASGGMDHSAHGAMSGGASMMDMDSTDTAPMDHSAHGAMSDEAPKMDMSNTDAMPMDHSGHMMMDSNTTSKPGNTMSHEMNTGGSK